MGAAHENEWKLPMRMNGSQSYKAKGGVVLKMRTLEQMSGLDFSYPIWVVVVTYIQYYVIYVICQNR